MSIVDVFSDLVIGLATFLFWRMFTAAPAPTGGVPTAAVPDAPAASLTPSGPRSLPALLDEICRVTGLKGVAEFLAGANALYEALLPAFAAGDIAAWRPSIAEDVYQSFQAAIEARKLSGEKAELVFIGIESAELLDAQLSSRSAEVVVRFVGLVVSATRDSSGATIAGDPGAVVKTTASWVFEHALGVPHANWILVGTEPE